MTVRIKVRHFELLVLNEKVTAYRDWEGNFTWRWNDIGDTAVLALSPEKHAQIDAAVRAEAERLDKEALAAEEAQRNHLAEVRQAGIDIGYRINLLECKQ